MSDIKPTKTIAILIALLINLGLFLVSPPGAMRASVEQSSRIWFHCCKKTDEGRRYCCKHCCLLRWDCRDDEDCLPR